jgi:hypothetical protein
MTQLLATALSFPSVVYTVLLGVVLLYWLFVVVGAASVDLFGDGADGAFEGGSVEGAAKGAAEGALGGHEGAAEGAGHHGEFTGGGWLGALRLRSVPATVVVSLIITFSWLVTMVAGPALASSGLSAGAQAALGAAALVLAPLLALPPTSLLVRPLARLFVTHTAVRGRRDFVGKVCTVRTGTVDASFGEAVLAERGAEVIVRVRVDGGPSLGRGDRALIVAFDEQRDAFTVAPFDEIVGGRAGGG